MFPLLLCVTAAARLRLAGCSGLPLIVDGDGRAGDGGGVPYAPRLVLEACLDSGGREESYWAQTADRPAPLRAEEVMQPAGAAEVMPSSKEG